MVCYLHRLVRNPSDIPYQPGVSAVKDPVAGRKRYRVNPSWWQDESDFPELVKMNMRDRLIINTKFLKTFWSPSSCLSTLFHLFFFTLQNTMSWCR